MNVYSMSRSTCKKFYQIKFHKQNSPLASAIRCLCHVADKLYL